MKATSIKTTGSNRNVVFQMVNANILNWESKQHRIFLKSRDITGADQINKTQTNIALGTYFTRRKIRIVTIVLRETYRL